MDNHERIGKGIEYSHQNIDDKHYFGGFFNLAQNNINQVFDEFCVRINGEKQKHIKFFSYLSFI